MTASISLCFPGYQIARIPASGALTHGYRGGMSAASLSMGLAAAGRFVIQIECVEARLMQAKQG